MKIEIKPVDITFGNCFEAVLANIAIWKKREYELMYINEWDFKFDLKKEGYPNRIGNSLDSFINLSEPLNLYHGIEFLQNNCTDHDSLINMIKYEILSCPVTVKMDSYYCPWDKNYKKKHNHHIFFVNGIKDEETILYCTDPFYNIVDKEIHVEDFFKGYTGDYGVFRFCNYNETLDNKILFNSILKSLLDKNIFISIRNFAEEINNLESFIDERKGYNNAWETPLFKNVLRIANGRKNIPILLKYIFNKLGYKDMDYLIGDVKKLSLKWTKIKDLTLRNLINDNVSKKNILTNLIYEVADNEENAIRTMNMIYLQ